MNWLTNATDDQALRLLQALEAAVRDSRLEDERGRPLRFYFDSDIVLGAFWDADEIVGTLRPDGVALDAQTANKVVFRALWASGFGCPAAVLWPHVPEVIRGANERFESGDVNARSLDAVRRRARSIFTKERLERVLQRLNAGASSDFELAADTLPVPYLAVAVASLRTWPLRWRLIGDRLELGEPLDEAGIERFVSEQHGDLERIATRLQYLRSNRVHQLLVSVGLRTLRVGKNNWRDACAVLELSRHFASDPGVRFVTGTEAISHVVGAEKELFSAEAEDGPFRHGATDHPGGPLRSGLYMLIRMMVPSLAFPDRREVLDLPDAAGLSIKDFEDFLGMARTLVDQRQRVTVAGILEAPAPAATACAEVLGRFLTVSGFASVWFQSNSKALSFLVENLADLAQFGETVTATTSARPATIRGMEQWKTTRFESISERLRTLTEHGAAPVGPATAVDSDTVTAVVKLGAGRWLAALYPGADTVEGLVALITRDLQVQAQNPGAGAGERADALARAHAFAAASEFAQGSWSRKRDRRGDGTLDGDSPAIRLARTVIEILEECNRFFGRAATTNDYSPDDHLWQSLDAGAPPETRWCFAVMLAWRAFHWCDLAVVADHGVIRDPAAPSTRVAAAARDLLTERLNKIDGAGSRAKLATLLGQRTVEDLLDLYSGRRPRHNQDSVDFSEAHSFDAWAWAAVLHERTDQNVIQQLQIFVDRYTSGPSPVERYIRRHVKAVSSYLATVRVA